MSANIESVFESFGYISEQITLCAQPRGIDQEKNPGQVFHDWLFKERQNENYNIILMP